MDRIFPSWFRVRLTAALVILVSVIAQACSSGTLKSATSPQCDPNYSGCVPIASDVDCEGGPGDGPAYVKGPVRVIGKDIYKLDRDRNGIGCESPSWR